VASGTIQALARQWITDDAYISFRYARNLLHGLGLVFNAGERVEGYSNFLWTVWIALGMRLGVTPERFSIVSGVVCFAASLALLVAFTYARRREISGAAIPVAAILAALNRDESIFATSGLESSLFCLLGLAGYVMIAVREPGPLASAGAALAFSLAALTRPDGALFVVVGAVGVIVFARRRLQSSLAYAATAAAILIPYGAWKLHFYGDLMPNTYYAKSAYLSWYSQGLAYLALFFARYWVLALGVPLAAWAALAARRDRARGAETTSSREWTRPAALAALCALAYTLSIARVGGDFMFARLLIPAAPFYAILVELGLERLTPRTRVRAGVTAALALGLVATPMPVTGYQWKWGVGDEWDYYRSVSDRPAQHESGERLRRMFAGLPLRIAFVGTQAMIAYESEAPVAIEATAGLTDSFTAHQRLERRGRPGHEKHAPWDYLIERRRTHLVLTSGGHLPDTLAAYIPVIPVSFDGLVGTVLTWDTPIMTELERRGAKTVDFIGTLDLYIHEMPTMSDSAVRFDYARLRRFYFDTARDSAREAPFRARLAGSTVTPARRTRAAPD
jgi:hypothetical protein